MTLVIDANVAVKWFIQQQGSDDARRVQAYQGGLIAPAMLIPETTSALWRHVQRGDVPADHARSALVALPRWFNELVVDQSLALPAFDLAVALNFAPYDLFYLALAIDRGSLLVTADKRFINRLASTPYKSHVVHLADWT
jgi:predicted nucleic acid-binding protein